MSDPTYRTTKLACACLVVLSTMLPAQKSKPQTPDAKRSSDGWEQIEFPSADGLAITGDLYLAHEDPETPFMVLCHQARWSRGEYRETAPKFNKLGFNCLAIDQRSGGVVNGVANETARRAKAKKLGLDYIDARPDIIAALLYARKHYAKGKLILVGSSYSSALALQLIGSRPKLADGVMAFAPGEYFKTKGSTWVIGSAVNLKCPVFITSAKRERGQWWSIYSAIRTKKKNAFVPETKGQHGSRALWKRFADHPAYWKAVEGFLALHFPRK